MHGEYQPARFFRLFKEMNQVNCAGMWKPDERSHGEHEDKRPDGLAPQCSLPSSCPKKQSQQPGPCACWCCSYCWKHSMNVNCFSYWDQHARSGGAVCKKWLFRKTHVESSQCRMSRVRFLSCSFIESWLDTAPPAPQLMSLLACVWSGSVFTAEYTIIIIAVSAAMSRQLCGCFQRGWLPRGALLAFLNIWRVNLAFVITVALCISMERHFDHSPTPSNLTFSRFFSPFLIFRHYGEFNFLDEKKHDTLFTYDCLFDFNIDMKYELKKKTPWG